MQMSLTLKLKSAFVDLNDQHLFHIRSSMKFHSLILATAGFVLCGCSSVTGSSFSGTYQSPLGGFSCGPFIGSLYSVSEATDAHATTVRIFFNGDTHSRIDVEEINRPLPIVERGQESISNAHDDYLRGSLLPLVIRGVPNASVIAKRSVVLHGKSALYSAILLPGVSNTRSSDGTVWDGIRGSIQYTNGRYMYVVSFLQAADPSLTLEKRLDLNFRRASNAFNECSFPT